jgi:acyl-CoA hydrolase/GNAT superfamily N-acetyltransferase
MKERASVETTAAAAIAHVASGSRVFVGSGCAKPQTLVRELARQADRLRGVEIVSLLTFGAADYAAPEFDSCFRHNAYFIGSNVREAVRDGRVDYTPIFLSEIPDLMRRGQHRIDVALVQLSPPDEDGYCSLGIHVDIEMAAIESARLVIAEINPAMPRTSGPGRVSRERLDYVVSTSEPLIECSFSAPNDDLSDRIGRHVASLIDHGSCLQLGIGTIPDAVARHLSGKRNLGVHTEMFSDGLIPLFESGAIDNSRKDVLPGKTVVSFVMGTRKLYDFVDRNPDVEFHPSDFVNDPRVIARNEKMVSINSALQVDLTGQVCSDSLGYRFYSGIGGQVDFIRGAAMSRGGKPIIALPSTACGGAVSRIVAHLDEGAGVVTSRGDVHFVVTEYGVAYLHGKTIRERALALIQIAHPKYRATLYDFIRERHYVHTSESAWREATNPVPEGWTTTIRGEDSDLTVRPLVPGDSRHLQEFFYTHAPQTIYHRYFTVKKEMTMAEADHLCALNYDGRMAFGVFENPGPAEHIVAVGRYDANPRSNFAETAIVVGERWRKRGIGRYLLERLIEYARSRGIAGITSEILAGNQGMVRLHQSLGHTIRWDAQDKIYVIRHTFEPDSAKRSTAVHAAQVLRQ